MLPLERETSRPTQDQACHGENPNNTNPMNTHHRGQTAAIILTCMLAPAAPAFAAFGLTDSGGKYTVDTGAGLVFRVNKSNGDIDSITYNGTQLQQQSPWSHISSGLGSVTATGSVIGGNVVKLSFSTSTLTHYLIARSGYNNLYMATHITAEPSVGELRFIARLQSAALPNSPVYSDLRGNTGAIESSDVFGMSNGHTRSKYYGNSRAIDLGVKGVTGSGVGVFMHFGNRESASGGPFFRDIENQHGSVNELYNYMNSGHNQTEAWRMGLHGPYAYVFTNGSTPSATLDYSWIDGAGLGLTGYVPASGRGYAQGKAQGVTAGIESVVGFANTNAQYWVKPNASTGNYSSPMMKPGSYTATLYQGELAVATRSVTISAGAATTGQNLSSTWSTPAAVFRIGQWDGKPDEFKNGQTFPIRHPSDSRNASWGPTSYGVGGATNAFPAAQWMAVNNPTTVTFTLTSGQIAARTVRIGITAAYAGGRPKIQVNGWSSSNPAASSQPGSRSLTIGTYRGNNTLYTYGVPASAFVAGANTMTISVISGSSGSGFLSPGCSYDCVEMY